MVQLAGDLGYGVPWLVEVLTIAIVIATAFFIYVTLSTKSKHPILSGSNGLKYQLHKYHAERYWAIFVAGLLAWLWFIGYSWMPPVAFSDAVQHPEKVHTIKVTAGQWFWSLEDGGYGTKGSSGTNQTDSNSSSSGHSGQVKIKAGETVRFVARSLDVNHGFGILQSSKSMDSPLMQMQVVPGFDNVFYYTFDNPGNYTIRCLEYCGWSHPFMVSQITVVAA